MSYSPQLTLARLTCSAPLRADPEPLVALTTARVLLMGQCTERAQGSEGFVTDFEMLAIEILSAHPSSVVRLSGGPGTGRASLRWWCSEAHRLLDEQRWRERVARGEAPPIDESVPTHLHYGKGGHPR